MDKIKIILKDNTLFIRYSFFIVFNAILLYILYFLIKDIGSITRNLYQNFLVLVDAFKPLLIGLVLAYLLNPMASFIDDKFLQLLIRLPDDTIQLEKKRNTRYLISVLLTYLLVITAMLAILYGFTIMLGHISLTDIPSTFQNLMGAIIKYEATLKMWIQDNIPQDIISIKIKEFTNYLMNWFNKNMSATSAISFVTNLGDNIVDFVIGIIISIYLMKDKKFFLGLLREFLHLILPQKTYVVFIETLNDVNSVLSRFIRGTLLDSLFAAILSSIGLSIIRLEAAVFIGVFAGLANVIPYFGPVLGMIPAFLMGLYTGGFWHGILAIAVLLVVQQIDSNFIYPKVVGSSTGLNPLIVLLAVSVFGYFGGIIGMLLAVPLAGIIQIFVIKWVYNRKAKLNQNKNGNHDKIPPIMN